LYLVEFSLTFSVFSSWCPACLESTSLAIDTGALILVYGHTSERYFESQLYGENVVVCELTKEFAGTTYLMSVVLYQRSLNGLKTKDYTSNSIFFWLANFTQQLHHRATS